MSEAFCNSALQLRPPPSENLGDIGLFEFLDVDQRPIFIIDLSDPKNKKHVSIEIFRSNRTFQDRKLADAIHSSPEDFKTWIISPDADPNENVRRLSSYPDIRWTSYTLRQKWRFVCAEEGLPSIAPPMNSSGCPPVTRYAVIFNLVL